MMVFDMDIDGVRAEGMGHPDCGLRFCSNSCGELVGKYNPVMGGEPLPEALASDYERRWSDDGERCLLATLDGRPGIAFLAEWTDEERENAALTRSQLRPLMVAKAVALREQNPDCEFIIRMNTPLTSTEVTDEFIVFVPHDVSDERFRHVALRVAPELWNVDDIEL